MVSDRIYDLCRPIVEDEALGDEEKTDKLEELLSSAPTSLKGKALEDAVLGTLWQYKGAGDKQRSPQAVRGTTVIRSRSPAPWLQQRSGTPGSGTSSPRPSTATPVHPPGLGPQPPAFARTKSSTASPFSSPRPSPRLPVATPTIPHSPRLSAYQFSDSSPTTENYGDYGSDIVDGLVGDETSSNTSFGDNGSDFITPYTSEMSTYDMLRSILQDHKTDEELEQVLEANGYDLSQTIHALMEASGLGATPAIMAEQQARTVLIGKSLSPSSRPVTPAGQQKSPIVCRYWLASGHCARADCRFAHEVQNHVCKYWLQGNCIAGPNCLFSHDPALLMQQLNFASSGASTPQHFPPNFQLQDYDSFPALQPTTSNPYEESASVDPNTLNAALQQQQQQQQQQPLGLFPTFTPTGPRHPNSRPGSRHASRAPTPNSQQPNFQDDEAFPTLGSAAAAKPGKRHHGKRGGHGHHGGNNPSNSNAAPPSNLADIVRMTPSPGPGLNNSSSRDAMRRGLKNNRSFTSTTPSNTTSHLPPPTDIPWLPTGSEVNKRYLELRTEAFKHGGLRNKFLQSAAQAWNRSDARGAKALSLRGQNENARMRELHREAAATLYQERNKGGVGGEVYVDLHGLHAEEAVEYLHSCLQEQRAKKLAAKGRVVYAICGTGHHSKGGKDKVGKAVRAFLAEGGYAFKEFSVPGDRNNVGGILGVDVGSGNGGGGGMGGRGFGEGDSGVGLGEDTKVLLVKEDPRKAGVRVRGEEEVEDEV